MNPYDDQWTALVRECQFLVAQFNQGALQLSRVPIPTNQFTEMNHQAFNFHLYEGMLSVTTALERLCKLTLSSWGYLTTGKFPRVQNFGHNIGDLFRRIEEIDFSEISTQITMPSGKEVEGSSNFDAPLVALMTYYASGHGRYAYLDSLSALSDGREVPRSVSDEWLTIVRDAKPVPDWLQERCQYPEIMSNALQMLANETGAFFVETAVVSRFEFEYGAPLVSESANVALQCFDYAQWVSAIFKLVSHEIIYPSSSNPYSARVFPTVSEMLASLLGPQELWFENNILFVDDYQTTMESVMDFHSSNTEQTDQEDFYS